MREGIGHYIYTSGNAYYGEWKNDQKKEEEYISSIVTPFILESGKMGRWRVKVVMHAKNGNLYYRDWVECNSLR